MNIIETLKNPTIQERQIYYNSSFFRPKHYQAYVDYSNEKSILQNILLTNYTKGNFPIKVGDKNKKILDLGAGLGSNTKFLQATFPGNEIWAIEPNKNFFLNLSCNVGKNNIILENLPFEDFKENDFDFILISHVLQYIDTPIFKFIKKIIECLKKGGEAWIVLQEYKGINQLIEKNIHYLDNPSPYFNKWFIHNNLRKILSKENILFRTEVFNSYFFIPNMNQLSEKDIDFLNFVFIDGFDNKNKFLTKSLSTVISNNSVNGLMLHEVGISKLLK